MNIFWEKKKKKKKKKKKNSFSFENTKIFILDKRCIPKKKENIIEISQ